MVPVGKEPSFSFLPDVLARRIEGWSQQRTTRTMPMGCSECSVQLRVPRVMGKTSRSSQQPKSPEDREAAEKCPSKNLVCSKEKMVLLKWAMSKNVATKKKIIYRSEELNWLHSFHVNDEEQLVLQKCNENVALEGVKLLRDINSMSEIWFMLRVLRLWN